MLQETQNEFGDLTARLQCDYCSGGLVCWFSQRTADGWREVMSKRGCANGWKFVGQDIHCCPDCLQHLLEQFERLITQKRPSVKQQATPEPEPPRIYDFEDVL
jgi:hypothetical protein